MFDGVSEDCGLSEIRMLSRDQKKRPGTWKIRGDLADEISEELEKLPRLQLLQTGNGEERSCCGRQEKVMEAAASDRKGWRKLKAVVASDKK